MYFVVLFVICLKSLTNIAGNIHENDVSDSIVIYCWRVGQFSHVTSLLCVTGGRWTIKFGTLTLTVKQGDITHESTDAIVNSSNAELKLDIGNTAVHF